MKLFLKSSLLIAIIGVHTSISLIETNHFKFPTIPALTHTPGMGLSLIGKHADPPHLLLDSLLHKSTKQQQQQVRELRQTQYTLIQESYQHKLSMQSSFFDLTSRLPKDTIQMALLSRWKEEQRIGEMKIWDLALKIQSR